MRKSALILAPVAALLISNAALVRSQHFNFTSESGLQSLHSFKGSHISGENAQHDLNRAAAKQDRDKEADLLVKTAKSDPDPEARRHALINLSRIICEQSTEFAATPDEKIDADTQKQKYEVLAVSKRRSEEAIPRLIDLAKTHPQKVIRRHALFYLGHSGDEQALKFFEELLLKERNSRTR